MTQNTPKEVGPRASPEPGRMIEVARRGIQRELASGRDETNPEFLFQCTRVELVLAIADGLIDPVALARRELASRGLDQNGVWVGFEEAARVHGVKL